MWGNWIWFMNDESGRLELELERRVDRELRALAEPQAPDTLLHRVMLSVHQRARQPWWRRAWLRWPLWARGLSLVAMLACAAAVLVLLTFGLRLLPWAEFGTMLGGWVDSARPVYEKLVVLGGALLTTTKALGHPFWVVLVGVAGVAYVACIGLGTVCYRLANNRA